MKDDISSSAQTRVVVVNDDPVQLTVLAGLLSDEGFDVRTFERAGDALRAMDPLYPPHLLVTDLYMPGIDGWRFCRLLRSREYQEFNELPILVVSATFSGEEASRITTDLGANAFLPAPVDGKRFGQRVRELLTGERPRDRVRVLIVEDNASLARLLERIFETDGYETDTVHTAEEAERAFRQKKYEVAILDYHLPDGKGDTLLDTFQIEGPDCVCLMVTADAQPDLALAWMQRGAAAYLRKPFDAAYLLEICTKARRERALIRAEVLLEERTRQLREKEDLFRMTVDSFRDAFYLVSRDFHILLVNERLKELCVRLGLESNPAGMSLEDLFPFISEEVLTEYSQVFETGQPLTTQEHTEFGGVSIHTETQKTPVMEGEEVRAVLTVLTDITEKRKAEEEHETLQVNLHQAQKMESIGRLAGGIAHDFNNMLSVILGYTELSLTRMDPTEPLYSGLWEVKKAAEHSADLTRQLLAFARKQTVIPKILDLGDTAGGMLKMLRRLIGEDIDLAWMPGANLWHVKMDPVQLDQVLANLCVNARDAISGIGRISIETENICIDEAACIGNPEFSAGDYVMLTVRDDGCGMDSDTLRNVFEPFFTTKEFGQGTGLGLATVYGIVKQNSGFISAESEAGSGTTMKVYIPRYTGNRLEAIEAEQEETPRAQGETILLVEDEPGTLRICAAMLKELDYEVLSAGTPGEAIQQAEKHAGEIHLLLTDVVMPGMNGKELADRIREDLPNLQCLYMSGYPADVIAERSELEDGIEFIQKPFGPKPLAIRLREVLDGD